MTEPLELSSEEQAYMDSGGETPLGDEAAEAPAAEPAAEEAVEVEPVDETVEQDAETVEEGAVEAEAKPQKSETVPRGRFERKARKAFQLEEELKAERERNDRLEAQVRLIAEAQTAPKEVTIPNPPDPEYDPEGYRVYQEAQLEAVKQENAALKAQTEQTATQSKAQSDIMAYTASAEAEFLETHSDYYEALGALQAARTQHYERYGMSEQMIQQNLVRDAQQLMATMHANKGDPAQYIYQAAIDAGYKPKNAASAVEPAVDAERRAAANVKMDTIERGQVAKTKMDGGAATSGGLTPEKLLAMNDEQYSAFVTKNPKAALEALAKFSK